MFLEKNSRYFRLYDLSLTPRKTTAPALPLVDSDPCVLKVLKGLPNTSDAKQVQNNGDVVELVEVERFPKQKAVALLFHRGSPDAADPVYRKRAGKKLNLRTVNRDADEEQSVSAHLIIHTDPDSASKRYWMSMEEVPGLSLGIVFEILKRALRGYEYSFNDQRGKPQTTYCVASYFGHASETITSALKNGHLTNITLRRPSSPKMADGEGIFVPKDEIMKVAVRGEIQSDSWKEKISNYVNVAKKEGWTDFRVDLELEDDRSKTVALDRQDAAKEISFVKSEMFHTKTSLDACSASIVDEIVEIGIRYIKSER